MRTIPSIIAVFFFICRTLPVFSQLPIKPARTISFTTDEGTNMNVDISPDGKTLVFDLLGDLYTLPVTGGKATQLTRGLAINQLPIWSPDGKKIAYYSDFSGSRHLNIRDLSGSFHRVLNRSEQEPNYDAPFWTADENFIIKSQSIYTITGIKQDMLSPFSSLLRLSPDNKIAFEFINGMLFRHNFAQQSTTPLTSKMNIPYRNMALSPDARWLAYIIDSGSNKCLMLKNLAINIDQVLVPALFKKYPFYQAFAPCHFAFSPDSRELYIGYGGKIHRIEVATGADHIIPFTADVHVDCGALNYNTFPVTHDPLQVKYTRSANASPDGKHLVFSALNKLYIMDLPDGQPHVLVEQPINQYQPIFSPDSKWVAYVSWCDTTGGALWRVPVAGGLPEQLTHTPGQYQHPAWSPDGKSIAFIKGPMDLDYVYIRIKSQLALLTLGDDSIRVLDDTVHFWNQLTFSSDGQNIIYGPGTHDYKSSGVIAISRNIQNNSTQPLIIGYPECAQEYIQGRSVSPDGRFFTFSLGENIYILPINKMQKPTDVFDKTHMHSMIRLGSGVDPYWEQGGKILSWSYANRFYSAHIDEVITAATTTMEKNEEAGLPDRNIVDVDIRPDRDIKLPVNTSSLYARGTLVLKNIRILTMQGTKVIEHGMVVVMDGRFAAVGEMGSIAVPAGARVLDLPGVTIMPGMVDLHVHIRLPPDIHPQQSWIYLAYLAYGATTVRDPSTTFDSFGYKELLESGQMTGPRLFSVGRSVGTGHYSPGIRIDNLTDALHIAQKRARLGAAYVKQYELTTRQERQSLLQASAQSGMNMTNEGDFDLLPDLAMIKDGSTGIEHCPEFGDVYNDVIELMARSGTFLTPTLQVRYGSELARIQANLKYWHQPDTKMRHFLSSGEVNKIVNVQPVDTTHAGFQYPAMIYANIRHHGGLVTLGSHSEDQGIGVQNELWAMQSGGLTNMEALQAATILGARALGIQKDLGSIEVGKIADLVILNKNPLDDIHNSREIRYVMKDGILYDGDTLDTIWPYVKKCPDWKHE